MLSYEVSMSLKRVQLSTRLLLGQGCTLGLQYHQGNWLGGEPFGWPKKGKTKTF